MTERTWCLHLGAHKTATTHLQAQIEALRPDLESAGVGFATLEQLRPVRALDLRRRRPKVWIAGAPLRREIEARIATCAPLLARMVLSQEDILGNASAPLHPAFYPRAGPRVRALASALLGGGQGGLWLSVRSLDRFLPAAYATALQHGALRFDAETLTRRALANPPDWSALMARLVRAAPGVAITVWDYGDYRANHRAIIEDLTGVTLANLPDIPDPPATRTPDSAAIREAENLPHIRDPHARAAHIGEIYQAAIGPRFSLFTKEQTEWLQALHSRQLRAIEQLPNVRLLRF